MGNRLRDNYGIIRQTIENCYQVEHPDNWLQNGNPWEIARPELRIPVRFEGRIEQWTETGTWPLYTSDAADEDGSADLGGRPHTQTKTL